MKGVVYWEKQGEDRMCALHCINSFLQGPFITEDNLSLIAQELDQKERNLTGNQVDGQNATLDGNFNVTVIEKCLQIQGYTMLNHHSDLFIESVTKLNPKVAFLCNRSNHWFTIRFVQKDWYDLNSLARCPMRKMPNEITELLLNIVSQNFSVFTLFRTTGSTITDLLAPNPTLNPCYREYQFYLTNEDIELKLKDQTNLSVDGSSHNTNNAGFTMIPPTRSSHHEWPKGGNTISSGSFEDDPQVIQLLRATAELYNPFENINLEGRDEEKMSIAVRFPSGKKLTIQMLPNEHIINFIDWIEYEENQQQLMNYPLAAMQTYSLLFGYPIIELTKNKNKLYVKRQEETIPLEYTAPFSSITIAKRIMMNISTYKRPED